MCSSDRNWEKDGKPFNEVVDLPGDKFGVHYVYGVEIILYEYTDISVCAYILWDWWWIELCGDVDMGFEELQAK